MQVVITSYNFLGQLRDNSKDLTFRVVIMDEAHYIKNKKVRPHDLATDLCCALSPFIFSAISIGRPSGNSASGT